jgi:DNA-binding transcriptional MerR regulator
MRFDRPKGRTGKMAVSQSNWTDQLRGMGAVAKEVGLTPRAIRHYQKLGLLRPTVSVKGSDRLFDPSDVQRLHQIKRLREVIGFSLAEIAELLDTDDVRDQLRLRFRESTNPIVRTQVLELATQLSERRLAIIEHKLAQVEALRREEHEQLDRRRLLLAEERARAKLLGDASS